MLFEPWHIPHEAWCLDKIDRRCAAREKGLVDLGIDPVTGDPITAPIVVPASMSVAGAIFSARFFDRMRSGGSHAGYLSDAELRLLAEWLDIGGQYFNNPFDAPIN